MSKRSKLLPSILLIIIILSTGYIGIGLFMHNQLADIRGECEHVANRPDNFTDIKGKFEPANPDLSHYYMPSFESVTFPGRESALNLAGWYVPGSGKNSVVIIVHGLRSCKNEVLNLLQAGMLNRAGFSVLLIDVRDAGESEHDDGLSAIGTEEYLDVLGAFDWLQTERGHSANQIGVLGSSLGAATVLIAFSEEPNLAAVFVDSPFDNLPQIIREELARERVPQFMYQTLLLAARLRGQNLTSMDPYRAIEEARGRPIFVTHGTADKRIGVHHSIQLRERAVKAGANALFWIIDGFDHGKAAGQIPQEYEARLVTFFEEALK